MNTITNEQIKQAFERPELLKELFPNAFKLNLEVGKWYAITFGNLKALFNFSGNFDVFNNPTGYGISYVDKEWMIDDAIGWVYDTIRKATHEEVETALIAEAKKRGYENGNHICLYNNSRLETDNIYSYNATYNLLNLGSKCASVVFVDGEWAEIQETELELTLDEIAEKFGVDKVKIKK